MKRTYLLLLGFLILASNNLCLRPQIEGESNLFIEGIPEIPKRIGDEMLRYQNTRSAYFQDWIGDGMLISTRFAETSQIHHLKMPGGSRSQITFFDEPVSRANVRPDGGGFLFAKDIGGNENYQLFYFDIESGGYRMLTDGVSRNTPGIWSNQGDRYAYASTERNGRDWDIFIGDLRDGVLVLENTGYWIPVDWAPNDDHLLLLNYVSINESYYYILNIY